MYPGQIILLSARVREGHILKAKFRLGASGGKAGAQGAAAPYPPAGAAHVRVEITSGASMAKYPVLYRPV